MLKFRYHFTYDWFNKWLDYSPTYYNYGGKMFNEDTLLYIDDDSPINGLIYPFRSVEEIKDLFR